MHYHLIGICGTAMASLAGMLQEKGHTVTGSDQNVYPPMSTQLEALGIEIKKGYKPENLNPTPDCVIVGNAISRGNLELEEVLNRKLVYRSQAEVVQSEFIRGKHSLVVAGTHGKTTTTTLASWMLESGGLNPSFLIGGIAENFDASFRVTDSDHFVIEGDEYDIAFFDKQPKFMRYLPEIAIIGNIEFDHADIYRDEQAVCFAFSRLMNMVPGNGKLIVGIDSPLVQKVLSDMDGKLHTEIESFGFTDEAMWQIREVETEGDRTTFSLYKSGALWETFSTTMIGDFNLKNITAAIIAAHHYGVTKEHLKESLESFKSVKRRAEIRGEENGITVIDDFAHHPTAVHETLKAMKERYLDRRIVAVFEPRSWSSRLAIFQDRYIESLSQADLVIAAGVFNASGAASLGKVLDVDTLISLLNFNGTPAYTFEEVDEIVEYLGGVMKSSDVIVVMSNGGFGGIHEKLLAKAKNL